MMEKLSLDRFIDNLKMNCGVGLHHKILVGVSGGADSMALLHLFINGGFNVEAVHVNFRLRGNESDRDELLVAEFCQKHSIVLHVAHYNTTEYAQQKGLSIEMAARELRYGLFNELCIQHGFQFVAIGHHANDTIETFFINLIRGTGIHGLTGIKAQNGNVVRPLLFVNRQQILIYCQEFDVPWQTDSSNLENDYTRNKVRNILIPVFESLNPAFEQTMVGNINRLAQVEGFLENEILKIKENLVATVGDRMLVPIKLLKELQYIDLVLYEILSDKGFNASQVNDIILSLNGLAGKQFFSDTHRLIRDRFNLIIVPRVPFNCEEFYVESDVAHIERPANLTFRTMDVTTDFCVSKLPDCAHFDADKIDFPLTIRHWQKGDEFRPLGMTSFKKLSDFFIDLKFSLLEKERCWILLSGDDIMWLVGTRIDDRFKVTNRTKRILEIIYHPS